MKRKLTKFFDLVKNSKEVKVMLVFNIIVVFILLLGNSLSVYTSNKNTNMANIKVNGLSFNMTTNSGTSDDRILHLQAGKIESFNIVLTNLNKTEVKYELIYDVCSDSKCTSVSKNLPTDIGIYKETDGTEINGNITGKGAKIIKIVTKNNSTKDYYIKLNLTAGYGWNEIELANQINKEVTLDNNMSIVAYVDGKEVSEMPKSCAYMATAKIYKDGKELTANELALTCELSSNKWSINFEKMSEIPDKINLYFKVKEIMEYDFIENTAENLEPHYTFTAPVDGTYKLETWGAQGGCSLYNNKQICTKLGYGGYSMGEITLKKGEVLYIYVGGAGANGALKVNSAGGYNGGGLGTWDNSDDETSGGGGGATHIAKVSGLLTTLESNKDSIIMVSGGAGGQSASYQAGSGGGFQGGISTVTNQSIASQDTGYAFGKGQDASGTADSDGVGGGGGGYYGGYMNNVKAKSSGSGGSGYIGSSLLTNKAMYCYNCTESTDENTKTISTTCHNATATANCAKEGNGFAKITYLNY